MKIVPKHHAHPSLLALLPTLLLPLACQQAPQLSQEPAPLQVAPSEAAKVAPTKVWFADLQELQSAAAQQNHALLAARLKADAAHNAIAAAGGYPDPVFKIGGFVQPLETRNGPTQAKLTLQQPLPWSEGLQAQEDVAKAGARQAEAAVHALQLRIRRQVEVLWWELAYLHRAQQILQANLELVESTHAVVSSRLEVGRARLPELLRVEMEAVQLRDRQRQFQDRLTPLRTRLNGLLGLSSSEANWQQPELVATTLVRDALELNLLVDASVLEQHPTLSAFDAAAHGKRARWRLNQNAERMQWAVGLDWTLIGDGPALAPDSGEDAVALMVSVKLPLHRSRDQARTAQAHAEWQMAEQERRQQEVQLLSEWQQARFELENSLETARLLQNELSTRVESALETELAAFETGDASFEGLLESLRLLLDFQLRQAEADKQIHQSMAKLREFTNTHSVLRED